MRRRLGSRILHQDRRRLLTAIVMGIVAAVSAGTTSAVAQSATSGNQIEAPGGIDIIAHDVGTWIAHAHAANYPAVVRRLALTESNIPGVTAFAGGIPSEAVNLKSWQFAFNRLNDLPEMLQGGAITGATTGCGHFLPEECPDELTEAVLKFWQSAPG